MIRHLNLSGCEALYEVSYEKGKEIDALCTLEEGQMILLRFVSDGKGIRLSAGEGSSIRKGKAAEKAHLDTASGIRLEVSRNPFMIRFVKKEGKTLLFFSSERHHCVFEAGEEGGIRHFFVAFDGNGKGFYGFGEKFDKVNQMGLSPKNVVYEQYTRQGCHTYLPSPWFFTEQGWGLFLKSACETVFDLTGAADLGGKGTFIVSGEVGVGGLPDAYFVFGPPAKLLEELLVLTGPAALPPSWAFGPWMSANGWSTQKEAMDQVRFMKELDIPATVIVLEAWSDETTFYIFNGARYDSRPGGVFAYEDFTFDANGPWPDPMAMVRAFDEVGLHLVLWQIPALKPASDSSCPQHTLDEMEAVEKGYCVRNSDGTPYHIPTGRWFGGSLLLDFTNPAAVNWWFAKRRYLRDTLHVEGFKTDGGEFVYDPDTLFYNGKTGKEMRNLYPVSYTQAYYDFLQEGERKGVTFSRAGYWGSQRRPLHWAGDQLSTFEELKSQLKAGLSAGMSGVLFWGFDLGGFAGDLPSTDLYLRAAAMATFCPIMQFHSEPRSGQYGDSRRRDWVNDRSPWHMARVNGAPEIIEIYRSFAKLRMKLIPYIYEEARFCVRKGRPLMAHLILDYPEDEKVLDLEDQYLFGRYLLVAPVLEEKARSRKVYLPEGRWFDFWTGEPMEGGTYKEVNCPLNILPVFSRDPELLGPRIHIS